MGAYLVEIGKPKLGHAKFGCQNLGKILTYHLIGCQNLGRVWLELLAYQTLGFKPIKCQRFGIAIILVGHILEGNHAGPMSPLICPMLSPLNHYRQFLVI